MSKKKKRLDKKLIEERLRELEAEAIENKGPLATKREVVKTPRDIGTTEKISQIKTVAQESQQKKLSDSDKIIIRDVKKVVILSIAIIVIFIALYFVNLKTNYILEASDMIFNILHIGQL
jgi:hypothetical protein